LATDEEVLASVKRGKPPVECAVIGTWQLRSYVRERLSDGQRHNQFGEAPVGYIGYAPDGRMYASTGRPLRSLRSFQFVRVSLWVFPERDSMHFKSGVIGG
jgi:lipocalin-like protein